jgi:hypothetical protein
MTLFLKKVQHLPVDGRATARHIPWRRFEQASVDAFSRIPLPGVLIGTFVRFRDVVSEFRHACHAAVKVLDHICRRPCCSKYYFTTVLYSSLYQARLDQAHR